MGSIYDTVNTHEQNGMHVYMADDESSMLFLLGEFVHDFPGYSDKGIDSFKDGADLLAAYLRQRPELIITDNGMLVMDGLELVKKIRDEYGDKETPIIFVSADEEPSELGGYKGCEFLRKPFYDAGPVHDAMRRLGITPIAEVPLQYPQTESIQASP